MKPYISLAIVVALIVPAFLQAQQSIRISAPEKTSNFHLQYPVKYWSAVDTAALRESYLKKSKTQRTVGLSLLGGGVTMAVAGGLVFLNNFELFSRKHDDEAGAGALLFYLGAGCTAASIPLLITSAHSAKKAKKLSVGTQEIVVPQQNSFATKAQPALKLSVGF